VAFVPTVWVYCRYMARAADLPIRRTFPLGDYLRVLAAATPGTLLAIAATHLAAFSWLSPPLALVLDAAIIVPSFVLVARATALLEARDFAFVREWLSLRVLRNPS